MRGASRFLFSKRLGKSLADAVQVSEDSLCESMCDLCSRFPLFSRVPFRSLDLFASPFLPEISFSVPACSSESSLVWRYGNSSLNIPSSLKGIDVFPLEEAKICFWSVIEGYPLHPFSASLGSVSSLKEGLFVYIPPGTEVDIDFKAIYSGKEWLERAAFYFVLGKGASLRLFERPSIQAGSYWVHHDFYLFGHENSSFVLERDWEEVSASSVFLTSIRLEEGASCTVRSKGCSSPWIWSDISAVLRGERAKLDIRSSHYLSNEQSLSITTWVQHEAPNTLSNQLMRKVLDSKAKSFFGGKIEIQNGASQAEAYQLNRDLLLSNGVSAVSLPSLSIHQGDVKATHGSTASGLDKELLFFLATRGISSELSREIAIEAFLSDFT
ncbi:SufD family Fe-S cluster assembly protein [Candidatus Similichlamydia epinepheli]|uniref:SufD family Fe-S cluster assembly protein n=1 Tax=Candidatus Similichlamydia epinepheli TaxID=1903953 RepID=UPI000D369A2F|nr:SufD family Fe-S cluster assembly protein [Candidatus Similichlamydia epinepheli]